MRITVGILAAISLACTISAATLCEQEFTVYGKTRGDHSLLFWQEYLTGECQQHSAHIICLFDTSSVVLKSEYGRPEEWIPEITANLPMEEAVDLTVDDSCIIEDSIIISPPPFDSTFRKRYAELVNSGESGFGQQWNRFTWTRDGGADIDYPVFSGAETKCVYAQGRGLYKNYGLQRAVYFPESRYVVLITDQPITAVGGDSLHGLLVFKLLDPGGAAGR